jgi:RNA recognition motif-containing protein
MRLQYFRGNVFVANLPPDFSDDQLAEAFDPYGMVLSASIARDPVTGKRLRYGFVDIATERAAKRAVDAMNGAAVDGHSLDVRISERPAGRNKANPARARTAPRRIAPRPAPHERVADAQSTGSAGEFGLPPTPRRQPTFQVERRPLPRRIDINRGS